MIVERLTRFDNIYDGYNCNVNGYDCCSEEECINCKHFHDVLDRLGAYEDSGLDPKTVQKVAINTFFFRATIIAIDVTVITIINIIKPS